MTLSISYRKFERAIKLLILEVLLKAIDLGLRYTNYRRVYVILQMLSPQPKPIQDLPHALALARLINFVALKPRVHATCLRRSLLLWWLLRWKGIPSEVRLGIGHKGGHAWVEHGGKIINDRADISINYPIQYNPDLTPEKVANFDT